jgi:hypothetical protein
MPKSKKRKDDGTAPPSTAGPASKKVKSAPAPESKVTDKPLIVFKNSLTVVTGLDGQTLTTVEPRAAPAPEKKKRIGKGKGSKGGGGDGNNGGGGGAPVGSSSSSSATVATVAMSTTEAADDAAESEGKKPTNKERKRQRDKLVRCCPSLCSRFGSRYDGGGRVLRFALG